MFIYKIIFLVFGINSFFNEKKMKIFNFMFFILFILIYSFRNEIGTDWYNYESYFRNISTGQTRHEFEFFYKILNIYGYKFLPSFRWLVFLIGIFNGFLFWNSTNKYSKNIGLVMFLSLYYMFYSTLEALRQSITFFIFYYSLRYIENDWKKYCTLNIIGTLFHFSGIFTLFLLFFNKYKVLKYITIIGLFFFSFFQNLISIILQNFPLLYSKYYWYMNVAKFKEGIVSFKLIEYIIFVCVYIFSFKKGKKDSWNKLNFNLLILGLVIQLTIGRYTNIIYRMTYYTDVGLIFGYSFVYNKIKSGRVKVIYIIVIIIYLFLKFYRNFPFMDPNFIYKIF